jgi:hypothetical protein
MRKISAKKIMPHQTVELCSKALSLSPRPATENPWFSFEGSTHYGTVTGLIEEKF